jgi:small subunit ribosomal protein S17e
VDRIKRLSYEVLVDHKSKFGEDFADNKKALDQVSIVRSKGLKNEIAGYITKFVKKEVREEKAKQARIAASKDEQQVGEQSKIELTETVVEEVETVVVEGGVEIVEATEIIVEATTEEIPSETAKEKTE